MDEFRQSFCLWEKKLNRWMRIVHHGAWEWVLQKAKTFEN